jgi:hypothetical protein
MVDISTEIGAIQTATYGNEVRNALCDALRKICDGTEKPKSDSFIVGKIYPSLSVAMLNLLIGTITETEG